jgi:hypothetical protein
MKKKYYSINKNNWDEIEKQKEIQWALSDWLKIRDYLKLNQSK